MKELELQIEPELDDLKLEFRYIYQVNISSQNLSNFWLLSFLLYLKIYRLSPLVREPVQILATASLAELFVNVIPGYSVHLFSDKEKSQKMKKETKRYNSLAKLSHSHINLYSLTDWLLLKSHFSTITSNT
jgi:hypothetical protein